MLVLYLLVGVILGIALFEIEGLLPGLLLGYLAYRDQTMRKKVERLSDQVYYLRDRVRSLSNLERHQEEVTVAKEPHEAEEKPVVQEEVPRTKDTGPLTEDLIPEEVKPEKETLKQEEETSKTEDIPEPEPVAFVPKEEKIYAEPAGLYERARAFVMQGNWLLLSGIAVLFIGLSLLVRLAIENELFPLELRLILVAVAGCSMIYIGSRLVNKRPQYGFVLEGGGLATLYLTIFASFRLYGFLSEPVATGLLMVVTMFGVLLGLAQNAQWVSVISMLGGFLVPVLISSEGGSHVALFSYYAILNVGILATAWYKPWRYLNLTGFVCTFGLGTAWGGLFYESAFFASIEPFLILFFVVYLCIGVLYTLQHDGSIKHAVDGTLVFGLPVVVFALQASLVAPFQYGIAISSAVMGICYLGLAQWLRSRPSKRVALLIESFDGIGIALVSLFIPFFFDTMWTGIGWAIEGAALVWLGIKQRRILVRVSGYILAVGSALAFLNGIDMASGWEFIPLSFAMVFIAYQVFSQKEELGTLEQVMEPVTMYAGLLFWLGGGINEIVGWWTYPREVHAIVVFSGVTALLCSLLGRAFSWSAFARASIVNVLFFGILALASIVDSHPFIHWGGLAWAGAFVATYASLYFLEPHLSARWLGRLHAFYLWVVALLGSVEGAWIMSEYTVSDSVWPLVGNLIVPMGIVQLVSLLSRQPLWPFETHKKAYLRLALFPVLVGTALISIGGSFENAGDGVYATYLPILNPLDVLLGGFVFIALFWYRRIREENIDLGETLKPEALLWSLVVLIFIWLNATIARSVHHWFEVPYTLEMWDSSVFQTALSICWTLLAVITMPIAARRGKRRTWIVAASLLAVVVVKLFAVDLSTLSTVPRIISFIGVGILLLVIGYIAPVPPKSTQA